MSTDQAVRKIRAAATVLDKDGGLTSLMLPDDKTIDAVLRSAAQFGFDEDRFGTGGQHVARDLAGKIGWKTLDQKGPDPERIRNFLGDEFQGMLGYDTIGKPAFWSHFGDSLEKLPERPVFRIFIADTLPQYCQGTTPQAESLEDMAEAFRGEPKDKAVRVEPRLEAQIRAHAKDFEKAYGISVRFVTKEQDADLTIMAWEHNDPSPRLLGFASFPESMNTWSSLQGLGQKPGYMFLSNDYTKLPEVSDQEVRNLFAHEFGHVMGWCHPHDLARLNMTQTEALVSTIMAYSDAHADDFKNKDGAELGAIDSYFRRWTPAPPLNPQPGNIYDLQAHMDASYEKSRQTMAFMRSGQLSTGVIVNSGKGAEIHGTTGDDLIDTNLGYASIVKTPGKGGKQKFLLSEGHIEVIRGVAGNNTIIPCVTGDQEILPGPGNNEIKFYYQGLYGIKTILSEGNDTLVLSESILLGNKNLKVTQVANTLVIGEGDNAIILGGKGIATIRIIDAKGQDIVNHNVQGLTAEQINEQVFDAARNGITSSVADLRSFTSRIADAPAKKAARG